MKQKPIIKALILGIVFVLVIIITNIYTATWAFEAALKLAIDDKGFAFKGKIFDVVDTGETYSTGKSK